ncbi:MAG: hypothetical protein KTR26_00875 [Flammeovirgaceae bacterium]|nr:hypothetical protein [Flammeovirgaceae bacterium]
MQKNVYPIFLIFMTFLISCESNVFNPRILPAPLLQPQQNNQTESIRFGGLFHTSSTIWDLAVSEEYYLKNFDIRHYAAIDSIIFSPIISANDSGGQVYVELFNLTDNVPIINSRLVSNAGNFDPVFTKNILRYFPSKKIDLALRLKSETGEEVSGYFANLFIYKSVVD